MTRPKGNDEYRRRLGHMDVMAASVKSGDALQIGSLRASMMELVVGHLARCSKSELVAYAEKRTVEFDRSRTAGTGGPARGAVADGYTHSM